MRLKKGIEIQYKKKNYSGEIPDDIFKEIYGKDAAKTRKKFEFAEPKGEKK